MGGKNCEAKDSYIKAADALLHARGKGLSSEQLKTFEETRALTLAQWQEAQNNEKDRNYSEICPRPTYIDYIHGGTKTNRSGEKKLSFTSSFFTLEKGKKVEFYSNAFDLGAQKPGENAITHKDKKLFTYQRVDNRPSDIFPCFTTQKPIEGIFANTIFHESEEKSDFNLAIAKAIASDTNKKAVVGILQEELKSDEEKDLAEANAVLTEKNLRANLGCETDESLGECANRVKDGF